MLNKGWPYKANIFQSTFLTLKEEITIAHQWCKKRKTNIDYDFIKLESIINSM